VKTSSRLLALLAPLSQPVPEHTLVITSFKRLIAALAILLPAAALVTSPVMAATPAKAKSHHVSVHKAAVHKTSHAKKAPTPTAS
jgi:hypothetical protein